MLKYVITLWCILSPLLLVSAQSNSLRQKLQSNRGSYEYEHEHMKKISGKGNKEKSAERSRNLNTRPSESRQTKKSKGKGKGSQKEVEETFDLSNCASYGFNWYVFE